jgi:hypothetical protein
VRERKNKYRGKEGGQMKEIKTGIKQKEETKMNKVKRKGNKNTEKGKE